MFPWQNNSGEQLKSLCPQQLRPHLFYKVNRLSLTRHTHIYTNIIKSCHHHHHAATIMFPSPCLTVDVTHWRITLLPTLQCTKILHWSCCPVHCLSHKLLTLRNLSSDPVVAVGLPDLFLSDLPLDSECLLIVKEMVVHTDFAITLLERLTFLSVMMICLSSNVNYLFLTFFIATRYFHRVEVATDLTALYSLLPSWVGRVGCGLTG